MATATDGPFDLEIVREFDAPRELVWQAWTGEAGMCRWACPNGFVITCASADLRVGGAFRSVMRSPEGRDYTVVGEYLSLSEDEELVMKHQWDRGAEGLSPETTITVRFEAIDDDRTRMSFYQTGFLDARNRDDHRQGWSESFDQLQTLAAEADRTLVVTRRFAAPRDLVWKCFTEKEHVEKWWGPRGFQTRVEADDLTAGGVSRYVMVGPDGSEYPVDGKHLEVTPPYRFVTTDNFSDQSQSQGLTGMVTTVAFVEESGGTRVVLTTVHPDADAMRTHLEMGVAVGWSSSFDCLAEQLVERRAEPNEIVVARVLDAPREVVFDAWTDPQGISNWWGPDGFTTTTHEADYRSGGVWRFTMHGPDGVDYPNQIVFDEVERPDRIAYRHSGLEEHQSVQFTSNVTFGDHAGRTLLTLAMSFPNAASRDDCQAKYGAVEGGHGTLERLAAHVGSAGEQLRMTVLSDTEVRLVRRFDATPEQLFEAFANADNLRRWWGCRRFETTECEVDFRVGGRWSVSQRAPDGTVHPFVGEYLEIVPGQKIVYTFVYDGDGVREHPSIETVTFEDRGCQTLLVNHVKYDCLESRDAHLQSGMEGGAAESMDRLAELLAGEVAVAS